MNLRMQHLADVNPPTPEFDRTPPNEHVTFMPLEAVWADNRLDMSRTRTKGELSTGYTRFKEGDILVPKVTPTFQAGRSAIVHSLVGGVGAGSTELHVLRPKPGVDSRFVRYVATSLPFLSEGVTNFQGVAGLQRIPEDFLRNFPVANIETEEQRRIADFLDAETAHIDMMSSLQRDVMRKLNERERSTLDQELDLLTDQHGSSPLRRAIRKVEQGSSPLCDSTPAGADEWGVLKVSAVKPGRFLSHENKRLPDSIRPDLRHKVQSGDLLITRANTPALVGAAAVVEDCPRSLLLCDKIFRINVDPSLDKNFIVLASRGTRIRNLCAAASHGTSQSMANLKIEEIKSWPIPTIGLPQQRKLILQISQTEEVTSKLRESIRRQLDLLIERRQALITAAVTGQLDVTAARTGVR